VCRSARRPTTRIAKTPTRRQFRDTELVEIITAARENTKVGRFVQTLGSRKLWIWLRGQGHDVARCTVERIMRQQGWEGARYGSKHKTTIADDSHVRYPDLVDRRFYASAPNRLWVADFTYVPTAGTSASNSFLKRNALPSGQDTSR